MAPLDFELAAKAGYGTNPYGWTLNPLGFGLGARGGVSFKRHGHRGATLTVRDAG